MRKLYSFELIFKGVFFNHIDCVISAVKNSTKVEKKSQLHYSLFTKS